MRNIQKNFINYYFLDRFTFAATKIRNSGIIPATRPHLKISITNSNNTIKTSIDFFICTP